MEKSITAIVVYKISTFNIDNIIPRNNVTIIIKFTFKNPKDIASTFVI